MKYNWKSHIAKWFIRFAVNGWSDIETIPQYAVSEKRFSSLGVYSFLVKAGETNAAQIKNGNGSHLNQKPATASKTIENVLYIGTYLNTKLVFNRLVLPTEIDFIIIIIIILFCYYFIIYRLRCENKFAWPLFIMILCRLCDRSIRLLIRYNIFIYLFIYLVS